jgi:hypothetical protein
MTRLTGILREDQYKVLIVYLSVVVVMRNVAYKSCGEHQKHKFCVQKGFCLKNLAVYEIKKIL